MADVAYATEQAGGRRVAVVRDRQLPRTISATDRQFQWAGGCQATTGATYIALHPYTDRITNRLANYFGIELDPHALLFPEHSHALRLPCPVVFAFKLDYNVQVWDQTSSAALYLKRCITP